MKKSLLHVALLALITPISSLYALGLGKMTVKSALDQPFLAEIDLIDVASVPLKDVKVGIADPENFEEIGLELAAVLSLFRFTIEKNEQGKEIITISSVERISDPYIDLVVDLTWSDGQLYKAYPVLLDPPGYHLLASTIQGGVPHYKYHQHHLDEPGVVDKTIVTTINHNSESTKDNRKAARYGPTIANESIWQIAQRYKSSQIILPQAVLAIVGKNPDAFIEGNLNGLKVGSNLIIPAAAEILLVPADLATAEVMAHDKAWNEKKAIEHVLTSPYINEEPNASSVNRPISNSYSTNAPPIPTPNNLPLISNANQTIGLDSIPEIKLQRGEGNTNRAELSLTVAAIESVREANALLMEQLHWLQKQNTRLQKELEQRILEIKDLRIQLQEIIKQKALLTDKNSSEQGMDFWIWLLFLLAVGSGSGFSFWYIKNRTPQSPLTPSPELKEPVSEPVSTSNADLSMVVVAQEQAKKDLIKLDNEPIKASESSKDLEEKLEDTLLKTEKNQLIIEPAPEIEAPNEEPVIPKTQEAQEIDLTQEPQNIQETQEVQQADDEISQENFATEFLEFESGLYNNEMPAEQAVTPEKEIEPSLDFILEPNHEHQDIIEVEEKPLEFTDTLHFVAEEQDSIDEEKTNHTEIKDQLKSPKALDTLLALAKTYMSINDFELARHSLEDVLKHGTNQQKEDAEHLIQLLDKK